MADQSSFYELLEVGANATMEEIEASYQRIISYLDPAALAVYSVIPEEEMVARRAELDEAYRTLSDPARRAAYDHARESGAGYPQVLVPASTSDSTMSVGMVRSARDESPDVDVDVDAIFRGEDSAPAAYPSPTRFLPPAPDEIEDDGPPSLPPPRATPPPRAPGAAARARPPPAGASPPHSAYAPSRPLGAGPDARVRSSEPTRDPRAGRRTPESPARPPAPARAGVRRLHPGIAADLTPDTEFSGAVLRRLRESCGATLHDVADITKIRRRYLEALEEHAFDSLPAPVYVRGFVTEYARALGLDTQRVAASYMAVYRRYRGEGV